MFGHLWFSFIRITMIFMVVAVLVGIVALMYSLAKQSGMVKVVYEIKKYRNAVGLFYSKYDAVPGDFKKANVFIGSHLKVGDGDKKIIPEYGENVLAWEHLKASKVTPILDHLVFDNSDYKEANIGINSPASRKGGAGYYMDFSDSLGYNYIGVGGKNPNNIYSNGVIFTARQTHNIDLSIDDGRPDSGMIRGYGIDEEGYNTPTEDCGILGNYKITNKSIACSIIFKLTETTRIIR